MDDTDAEGLLQNYEMYKAEGDLHLKKGLLAKAVDNYSKVCGAFLILTVGQMRRFLIADHRQQITHNDARHS